MRVFLGQQGHGRNTFYFVTYFFTTLSSISMPSPGPVGTSK